MALAYVKPSAPLPPPLLVTTIGCSTSLCLVMMLWTARAKLSVPPPGPAVATNSIGLTGCQAASAAPDTQIARPQAIAANFGFKDIGSSLDRFLRLFALLSGLAGLVLDKVCRGDGAVGLKGGNFIGVESVRAQNGSRMLAVARRAGPDLA